MLPVFSDDLSFDPTIVRLPLNALVRAVVVVIDKRDGEVQQIQFYDIKGNEILSAGSG